MTKVSVIIPAYNGDRYIAQAIDSVIAQTHTDYEIIVVDDGSQDNTSSIVQNYDEKVNYIYQTNQGVAVARNRGIKEATGEFIAFLDQDDLFLPDKLASQVTVLEQQPSLGLVNSGWQIVDQQGKVLAAVQPWQKLPTLDLAGLIVWKPVFLGAMLFRRSWLERSGGFDSQLEQTPDVELVLRLALLGCQADWLERVTVSYRQHEANVSNNTVFQTEELDRMLTKFFTQTNLPPQIKQLENQSRYQSLVWSAWRLYHHGDLDSMSDRLAKSFRYSSKYRTETVLHWIECFNNYAAEYRSEIDVYALSNSDVWKALIEKYVL